MTATNLMVTIPGRARPQGSKRHVGHGVMVESSKELPNWRTTVTAAAIVAARDAGWTPQAVAHHVDIVITLVRPKSHRTSKGLIKPDSPMYPIGRTGDIDKFVRAILDAITGPVLVDDSHVYSLTAYKQFGDAAKATVIVARATSMDGVAWPEVAG